MGHKPTEIQSRAHSTASFSGCTVGSVHWRGLSHGGETEHPQGRGSVVARYAGSPGSVMAGPIWLHSQHGGPGIFLPPPDETTVAPLSLFSSNISSMQHTSARNDGDNPSLTVVGPVAEPVSGGPFSAISTGGVVDNGRLSPELESVHRGSISVRPMASSLGRFSYKPIRVWGSCPRSGSVCASRQRTEGPGSIRQ